MTEATGSIKMKMQWGLDHGMSDIEDNPEIGIIISATVLNRSSVAQV